jgi:hypothetical protein
MATTPSTDKKLRHGMTNDERNKLNTRSGAALESSSTYCGIDCEDRIHYIDHTHGDGVAIFDSAADTDPLVITPAELPETKTPGEWAARVSQTVGWQHCTVTGYGADQ